MYLFTFLVAWFALAACGWIYAQDFAAQSVMPWLMQIISQSYTHTTSVVGAAIAIVGGLASAIVIAIVVLSLMAAAHRIGKLARSS